MSPSVAPFLGLALVFFLTSQLQLLSVKATEQENEDGHVVLPDHDDGEGLSQEPQPPPSIDSAPLTSALADALVSGDNHLVNKPRRGHDPIIFNTADCGSKKGCMFKPKDCIPHTNCSYAFSYSSDAENVYMELLGQIGSDGNAFVAVGFSTDALMGNDTVTDCSSFEGEPFTGRLSFNPGKTNRRVPVENNLQDTILTTHLAQLADGILYCRLSQKIVPVTDLPAYYVRPLNESYRIFLSSGLTESRQLTIHSLDTNSPKFPFISSSNIQLTTFHHTEPVDFSSPTLGAGETSNPNGIHLVGARAAALEEHKHTNRQTDEHFNDDDGNEGPFVPKRDEAPSTISPNVSGSGGPMPAANADLMQKLLKAHASMMVFAWTFFLATGVLSARFLRDHWSEKKIMKVHVWFLIHRSMNCIALLLITAAFVCMFTREGWVWQGPSFSKTTAQNTSWMSLHCMAGLLACSFVWFQPINAMFRCHPGAANRVYYNWIHRTCGFTAWTFAMCAITIAVHTFRVFSDQTLAKDIFITYLSLLLLTFCVLELLRQRKKWRKRHIQPAQKRLSVNVAVGGAEKVEASNNNTQQNNFVDNHPQPARTDDFAGINLLQGGILVTFLASAFAIALFLLVLIVTKQ